MKELCEAMLKDSPQAFGLVAREKLWRNVYYHPISVVRRIKKVKRIKTGINLQVLLLY